MPPLLLTQSSSAGYRGAVFALRVTAPERIDEISGLLHDWFFDLDDIDFSREQRELLVPFRRWNESQAERVSARGWMRRLVGGTVWEAPWYRWRLVIRGATSYRIVDDAKIGGADFGGVAYDAAEGTLQILGNIPVRIEVDVETVDVLVQETSEVLGRARFTRWLGGISYTGAVEHEADSTPTRS